MSDIGLLNYIKKEIKEGKSKEDIYEILSKGQQISRSQVDDVFKEIEGGISVAGNTANAPVNNTTPQQSTPVMNYDKQKPLSISFYIIFFIIIALSYYFFNGGFSSKPTAKAILPSLKVYMENSRSDCDQITLSKLSNITFGDYVNSTAMKIEGYPIYADSELVCTKTDNSRDYPVHSSYTYVTKASNKVIIAYAKKGREGWVIYMPEFLKSTINNLNIPK